MGYFKNICLLKAPQYFENPFPQFISDATELCYLAAMVEKDVETVSIPENFHNEGIFDSFTAFVKNNPVDLVAISSMTGAFNNALKLAEIAKRSNKYVVMGGYHPSALPEEVLKSEFVDALILGEGELTFKDFVLNGPGKHVAGMAYKENGGIVVTEPRPLIDNLDSIPHPLRRIRPDRFGEKGDDYSFDTIYTSRGCPWRCSFCANHLVNKRWRGRSAENVIEELSMLHDPARIKFIKIWDANFLTNIKRVEKICDMMIERGMTNFRIMTETRAKDIIRAEGIMDKLHKIGLSKVGMGIETPNVKTLELMKKQNTLDGVSTAVDILRKNRIKSHGYFIIGHYSETEEDTKVYPEFAKTLGIGNALFMVMTPYPGTDIYDEYRAENRITSDDYDYYNNFCTVVETKGMDTHTLKRMHAYCYIKYFNFHRVLQKKGFFKMASYLLDPLLISYVLYRMNKNNDEAQIKDRMFESLKDITGDKYSLKYDGDTSPLLRWFETMTVRVKHSPGKNIDFVISQQDDMKYLSIEESHDTGSVRGIVIPLDKVIRFAGTLYPYNAFSLLFKKEKIRNNPSSKVSGILSLLSDKAILAPAGTLLSLILSITGQSIASQSLGLKKT